MKITRINAKPEFQLPGCPTRTYAVIDLDGSGSVQVVQDYPSFIRALDAQDDEHAYLYIPGHPTDGVIWRLLDDHFAVVDYISRGGDPAAWSAVEYVFEDMARRGDNQWLVWESLDDLLGATTITSATTDEEIEALVRYTMRECIDENWVVDADEDDMRDYLVKMRNEKRAQ